MMFSSGQRCIVYLMFTSLSPSSISSFVFPPSSTTTITTTATRSTPISPQTVSPQNKKTTPPPIGVHNSHPPSSSDAPQPATATKPTSRSTFLHRTILTSSLLLPSLLATAPTVAAAAPKPPPAEKQRNLSPERIAAIVEEDLTQRSFLTNGDLTRSIYAESATFTDEIDTYGLEQWMKGTAKLFVGPPSSNLNLVGKVQASPTEVSFRFEEDLMFRIPFRPVVHLTGKVVLKREADTGLISSYRELWDQDVKTVLKSAKFSGFKS